MVGFLQRWEKILAPTLVLIVFLLNLSIVSRSPFGGWMDEVSYADPGLNLAAGKGFTSTDDSWQGDHDFFAGGSPLYPGGLALWAHIFGVSMISARAYCYSVFAVGSLFLWLGTMRLNLLTPGYRLFWIVFLSTEYAMNWMARNERYDVWIFTGLSLAWFGASLQTPLARYGVIFLGALICPFAGFISLPYIALLTGLISILAWFKYWKENTAFVAGAAAGLGGVLLYYTAFGALQAFRDGVANRSAGGELRSHPFYTLLLYPLDDKAIVVMIGLLIVLTVFFLRHKSPASLPWIGLGWGIVLLMPCMMALRGTFVAMYFYMVIVPLTLTILELTHQAQTDPRGRYVAVVVCGLMGFLCLTGLPGRIYTAAKEWDLRDPQNMHAFVWANLHPDDEVLADEAFYFDLRDYVKYATYSLHLKAIPPDRGRQINVLLVRGDGVSYLFGEGHLYNIGSEGWNKVAEYPTSEMMGRIGQVPASEHFVMYRREAAKP